MSHLKIRSPTVEFPLAALPSASERLQRGLRKLEARIRSQSDRLIDMHVMENEGDRMGEGDRRGEE